MNSEFWWNNVKESMKNFNSVLGVALIAIASFTSSTAMAQSEVADVRVVIDRLFDGMRSGDSTIVSDVLHEEALMARVGPMGLDIRTTDGFVQAVGSPHEEVWDERIWDVHIFVDGNLASAWMEFAFFLGEELSHCGVNSMQLFKTADGWKIIYIADTNRPPTCEPPADDT